ncbi:hypothetical protein LINGRAHAP2_LOCUS22605 [Linum grandiflorum]
MWARLGPHLIWMGLLFLPQTVLLQAGLYGTLKEGVDNFCDQFRALHYHPCRNVWSNSWDGTCVAPWNFESGDSIRLHDCNLLIPSGRTM